MVGAVWAGGVLRAIPRTRGVWLAFVGFIVALIASAQARASNHEVDLRQWPTIDWFLDLQEIGAMRASPNGRFLAVEIRRARARRARRAENGDFRADLWLIELSTGTRRQLTFGERDGSAYWNPLWSPDSTHIAALTNAGDGLVRAVLISPTDGSVRVLADRPIDIEVNFGAETIGPPRGREWGAWVDASTFLTTLAAVGEVNHWYSAASPDLLFEPFWAATRNGEASVSVWDSRRPEVCGRNDTLVALSTDNDHSSQILFSGAVRSVTISPNALSAVLVVAAQPRRMSNTPTVIEPDSNSYNYDRRVDTDLVLIDRRHDGFRQRSLSASGARFLSSADGPQWSGVGGVFAVPTFRPPAPPATLVFSNSRQIDEHVATSRVHAQLLARTLASSSTQQRQRLAARTTEAWRQLRSEIPQQAVDADSAYSAYSDPNAVQTMFSLAPSQVGVQVGATFGLFDVRSATLHDAIRLPGAAVRVRALRSEEPALAILEREDEYSVLRSANNRLVTSVLPKPSEDAVPLLIVPGTADVIWESNGPEGLSLWVTDVRGASPSRRLLHLNSYVQSMPDIRTGYIQYTLPSGERAVAPLLFPPGYDVDRSYPLVIEGYPGPSFEESAGRRYFRAEDFYNSQRFMLAGRGFIVARLSIPYLWRAEVADYEPLEYVAQVVDELAEAAIDQGLAQANEVGFVGHSYGGYTALAVSARSALVSATVSAAPFVDLQDYFSRPFWRYTTLDCAPNLYLGHQGEIETGPFFRMGGPSFRNPDRYARNSPLSQVGPSSPPTLILQGELDSTGSASAEAIHLRLARMGVHVQLARYWGEGHNLDGPGNIRDASERTIAWFETHLRSEPMASRRAKLAE